MQKTITLFFATILLGSFLITGCSKDSSNNPGGDPTPIGSVGNQFTAYPIGLTGFSAVVTKNEGGIATVKVMGTITDPAIKNIAPLLNSSSMATIDPVSGEFSVDLKVKFTSEGVIDYYATDGKGSTVVNYSSKVGDTYKCKNSEGETFTRTVTAKSETDDYYWGMLMIKTITVEEPISNPAVTKIVYRANHRFGIVNITAVLQDGTEVPLMLFSTNEN